MISSPNKSIAAAVRASWERLARPGKAWLRQSFRTARGREFVVSLGVVKGSAAGPVLTGIAGQHGMEHLGPLVLRDFFDEVDPTSITGDLFLCPCANPLALEIDFEIYPEREDEEIIQSLRGGGLEEEARILGYASRDDHAEYNMNRVWGPWRAAAEPPCGVAEEVADWLWEAAVQPADMVLDYHGLKVLKPLIYADQPALPWAPLLGIEAVWCTGPLQDITEYRYRRPSLQVCAAGKVGLCVEFSVQHGIKEHERAIGHFGLLNMMKALGMIEGAPAVPHDVWLLPSSGEHWLNGFQEMLATEAGHPHFFVEENQPLRRGDRIAEVRGIQTHEVLQTITAPTDGLMLDRLRSPVTTPGQRVCNVHTDVKLMAKAGEPYPVPALNYL